METNLTIDCQGLACPQPVLLTKDTLEPLRADDVLLVIVDNEAARSNVSRFAESQGHDVEVEARNNDIYHLRIRKNGRSSSGPEAEIICDRKDRQTMVVTIGSDTMGRGDDALGGMLMEAYLDTLSHFAKDISHIILLNSGVKLATAASTVLHHLEELEKTGIEILSCGTCLKHFGLTDQLAVGTVSNMYTIIEIQRLATKILAP